jgi:hypothetical protein
MKMSIQQAPVLTKVFAIQGANVKVKYSIDVEKDNPFHDDTEVYVYSVNGVPATFFSRGVREDIDREIREHAVKVLNEFDLDKGCGHDQYLSNQMN